MENLAQYQSLIAIAIGLFLCFFGYRLKKVAFIVIWFIIGFYLMSLISPKITDDQTWQLVMQFGAGILLGMLGFSIEKLCIFAVATFSVSTTLIEAFQLTEILPIALAIGAGVIVGCIAVVIIKPVSIITTALSGAKLIAKYSVLQFSLDHHPYFLIILIAAMAVGAIFQFKNCRNID